MKRLLTFAIAVSAYALSIAQNEQVNQFFNKYEGKEGFTSIMVSETMFDLMASAAPESEADLATMAKGIQGIRVLAYEQEDALQRSADLYAEAASSISLDRFEELLTVYDETGKVNLLVRRDPGNENIINELLILVTGEEFVLVDLFGDIDLRNISKIADSMEIEGLDNLKELDK